MYHVSSEFARKLRFWLKIKTFLYVLIMSFIQSSLGKSS